MACRPSPPGSDATRWHGGFSLIELIVVIVIICLLLVTAISRLLALQVDAERVSMQTVLGTLRSAIGMQVANHIVRNKVGELADVVGTNPMDRLAELPSNYLGILTSANPEGLESGNWYFDTREGVLVYLVRNKQFFASSSKNPPRARFAIQLVYADANGNELFDRGIDTIEGLRLSSLETYRWTN